MPDWRAVVCGRGLRPTQKYPGLTAFVDSRILAFYVCQFSIPIPVGPAVAFLRFHRISSSSPAAWYRHFGANFAACAQGGMQRAPHATPLRADFRSRYNPRATVSARGMLCCRTALGVDQLRWMRAGYCSLPFCGHWP